MSPPCLVILFFIPCCGISPEGRESVDVAVRQHISRFAMVRSVPASILRFGPKPSEKHGANFIKRMGSVHSPSRLVFSCISCKVPCSCGLCSVVAKIRQIGVFTIIEVRSAKGSTTDGAAEVRRRMDFTQLLHRYLIANEWAYE